MALTSLEPPTPSRLNPKFQFSRRENAHEPFSSASNLPNDAISNSHRGDMNLKYVDMGSDIALRPSTISLEPVSLSPHLGKANLSQRRETVGVMKMMIVKIMTNSR